MYSSQAALHSSSSTFQFDNTGHHLAQVADVSLALRRVESLLPESFDAGHQLVFCVWFADGPDVVFQLVPEIFWNKNEYTGVNINSKCIV